MAPPDDASRARGWTTLLAAAALALMTACGPVESERGKMAPLPQLAEVPANEWAALAGKRIFFGHQSVGNDILAGIGDLQAAHPQIRLELLRLSSPEPITRPALAHAMVGKNGDPPSKIRDFRRHVEQQPAPDIAFFKFCYVDIDHATDVEALFAAYSQAMDQLIRQFPKTRFLHATVPLQSLPPGAWQRFKQSLKHILGRPEVVAANASRQRYNDLLKQRYPADSIIDIALAESVMPDGTQATAKYRSGRVPLLDLGYTTDGGHLNETGRRRVAEQFLIALAHATGDR